MAGIFISYRREDSSKAAERIYSALKKHFKEEQVFIDVSSTPEAADYRKVIEVKLIESDVLIAVIGKKWLSVTNESGEPRLGLRNDYVRREIATALSRGIQVIPVLVDGARMPSAEQMPKSLKKLTFRQALQISEGKFDEETQRLSKAIERLVTSTEAIEDDIARRAYNLKIFDLIPKPISAIINSIGIDRRFLTTITTLILKPSQLKLLHVRSFSRPYEFLAACLVLNVLVNRIAYALSKEGSEGGSLVVRWLAGYAGLLTIGLLVIALDSVTPFLVRKRTAPPITFKTRFKYYCFIVGWGFIIDALHGPLRFGIRLGTWLIFHITYEMDLDPSLSLIIIRSFSYLNWVRVIGYTEQMRLSFVLFDFDWKKIAILILIVAALLIILLIYAPPLLTLWLCILSVGSC